MWGHFDRLPLPFLTQSQTSAGFWLLGSGRSSSLTSILVFVDLPQNLFGSCSCCLCVCFIFACVHAFMCPSVRVRMCMSARPPLNFKQAKLPVELLLQWGDFERRWNIWVIDVTETENNPHSPPSLPFLPPFSRSFLTVAQFFCFFFLFWVVDEERVEHFFFFFFCLGEYEAWQLPQACSESRHNWSF